LKLNWTPIAVSHLEAAYQFIARENESAAEELLTRIFSGVEMLGEYPLMGRQGRVSRTREFPIAGTPFVVCYRYLRDQREERIDILAVLHGARRWPEKF
jgi:plasmid stabilization system protein ParE